MPNCLLLGYPDQMSVPAVPPRRTQEERSAATRKALLDATIECLLDGGYARLTTNRIAATAGVSRGAIVHHYPTKAALVADSVRHLAELRISSLVEELQGIDSGADRVDAALDLLWETHNGPLMQAVFQLSVGVPDDEQARAELGVLEAVVTETIQRHAPALFAGYTNTEDFDDILYTMLSTMVGLAVLPRILPIEQRELAARWRRTKAQLRRLLEEPGRFEKPGR